MDFFKVTFQPQKSHTRLGIIHTAHGDIETPCFVPVATRASLKSLSSEEISATHTQLAFVNTYHLHLRPGDEIINNLGGIHTFMHYRGPLISDSGGFQAFSLGYGLVHGVGKIANIFPDEDTRPINFQNAKKSLVRFTDEGIYFRSHLDGRKIILTPQKSISIQENLATDIALVLDECTSPLSSKKYVYEALQRTEKWALSCLESHKLKSQALLGIVQGSRFPDLRLMACQNISKLPFSGLAVGGDFGRSKKDMVNLIRLVISNLPKNMFRHVLGIGEIDDIFNIIENGADSFDCVMPTRLGRMGQILTAQKPKAKSQKFRYNILKSVYENDKSPLDAQCACWVCQNYSRAYIHHLFRARELLGYRLATFHNVYFLNSLLTEIRLSIKAGKFSELKTGWLG